MAIICGIRRSCEEIVGIAAIFHTSPQRLEDTRARPLNDFADMLCLFGCQKSGLRPQRVHFDSGKACPCQVVHNAALAIRFRRIQLPICRTGQNDPQKFVHCARKHWKRPGLS